jgi:hypothetical protein
VLGVATPSKIDLNVLTNQIGEVGKQFGQLATEVYVAREKAQGIGKILS